MEVGGASIAQDDPENWFTALETPDPQLLPSSLLHDALNCAELSHSVVSDSVTPWTVAHQAPLSMRILQARKLEWVGMPSSRGSSQPRG